MKRRNFYRYLIVALLCPFLAGCPAWLRMEVWNMSQSDISVTSPFSSNMQGIIGPGQVKRVSTVQHCIEIEVDDVVHEFSWFPAIDDYQKREEYFPQFNKYVFTSEMKLYLVAEGMDESDWLEMTRGCPSVETASE